MIEVLDQQQILVSVVWCSTVLGVCGFGVAHASTKNLVTIAQII